jgi:hypothetical protein
MTDKKLIPLRGFALTDYIHWNTVTLSRAQETADNQLGERSAQR